MGNKFLLALSPLLILIMPAAAFACDACEALKNWDISIAAGPSWHQADNTTTSLYAPGNQIEVDDNTVSSADNGTTYRIGVGYHAFAERLADRNFLNDLLLQVNYYHDKTTIKGDVWQDGYADNFTFEAPLTSDRLMLDVKPTLFSIQNASYYTILGAGVAWNQISYSETALNADGGQARTLDTATNRNFVYDLGLGVNMHVTTNAYVTLEYLYTTLGGNSPSTVGSAANAVAAAPNFVTHSQSALLGLGWAF